MFESRLFLLSTAIGSALFLSACGGSDEDTAPVTTEPGETQDAAESSGETASASASTTEATPARSQYEREGDRAKGDVNAPVVFVEYASTACPGCGAFHANVMPTIDRYVESGDVRFVFREMLTGQIQLAAAGFMIANCAGDEKYLDVIDTLFDQQQALFVAMQQGSAGEQLNAIARSAGFSDEEYRECMRNNDVLEDIQNASRRASADGVTGTPSFVVNGQTLDDRPAPDGSGTVFYVGNTAIEDDQGYIPAAWTADNFERIILYFKDRATENGSEG